MMKRDEMLKTFARQRKDEIVVAVYTAAQELTHIQPNDLNYTFIGAMGQGSSHALGLALGRPDKKVVVFDGDGSLLMNLGSLVTIANQAPKNYVHCVCENGCYETNGSVPIPRVGQIRFAELAKSARSIENDYSRFKQHYDLWRATKYVPRDPLTRSRWER